MTCMGSTGVRTKMKMGTQCKSADQPVKILDKINSQMVRLHFIYSQSSHNILYLKSTGFNNFF
jgi:hypothetical protein